MNAGARRHRLVGYLTLAAMLKPDDRAAMVRFATEYGSFERSPATPAELEILLDGTLADALLEGGEG